MAKTKERSAAEAHWSDGMELPKVLKAKAKKMSKELFFACYELPYGNSLTIPDKALSLKQLMEEHVRPSMVKSPLYQWLDPEEAENQDVVDFQKMDKQEKIQYARALEERIEELQATIQEREIRLQQAKEKAIADLYAKHAENVASEAAKQAE